MDYTELLREAIEKQKANVEKINALVQERQELMQEAIRLEGEIRLLRRLRDEK